MEALDIVTEYVPEPDCGHLDCSYVAVFDGGTYDLIPDGCVDVIYRGDGAMMVCGPESRGWSFQTSVGATTVGVRLRPGVAPLVMDAMCDEFAEQRIDLRDVTPDAFGSRLRSRLSSASSDHERRRLLVEAFATPVRSGPAPRIGQALGDLDRGVAVIAGDLGWSRRHLSRLSAQWLGLDPTTYRRVIRLKRATGLMAARCDVTLTDVAAAAGYSDQSHLHRDCVAILGRPPSEVRRPRADGGTGTDPIRVIDDAMSPPYKEDATGTSYRRDGYRTTRGKEAQHDRGNIRDR